MKINKLLILVTLLSVLGFTSCDNRDEKDLSYDFNFGSSIVGDFKGRIVDVNHEPISNVAIKLNGVTTTTDSNGQFTLEGVSVLERFAYLTAVKEGFLNGSRTVMVHEGFNSMEIMLLPENVVATIQSGEATNVILPNSVKVGFDGAFMTENGTAYTGNVKVIVNHLDAADPDVFMKMPGSLIGTRTDGSISGMETYGMINVEMKGDNNEKLQIQTGHTAEVVLPIAPNQLDTAPATIQLWHFNEVKGLWEENGYSTRVGNKYYSTVSHFSWWNNDWAYVVATLNVIVKNVDESRVPGVRVTITRQNGSTGDVLMDLGVTGPNGTLSAGVPRNEVLTFRAYTVDGILINTQTLPASNQMVRNVEVIIPIIDKK